MWFERMLEDFKKFALRGNVVDLAVGVIIGAAFSGIVNALVADVIMPLIGKCSNSLRLPMVPASEKAQAAVREAMVHAGLIN